MRKIGERFEVFVFDEELWITFVDEHPRPDFRNQQANVVVKAIFGVRCIPRT